MYKHRIVALLMGCALLSPAFGADLTKKDMLNAFREINKTTLKRLGLAHDMLKKAKIAKVASWALADCASTVGDLRARYDGLNNDDGLPQADVKKYNKVVNSFQKKYKKLLGKFIATAKKARKTLQDPVYEAAFAAWAKKLEGK